mgnify:CR=1 FL=1
MCYFGRMCGRFNVIDDPLTQLLSDITGQHEGWTIKTEYNLGPTQKVPVLLYDDDADSWDLRLMRWWLTPSWSDGPSTRYSMFNAKSETLSKSRAYREPFKKRRCVIPASGYYEWRKEGSNKLPYYMTPDYENGFAFAGLWDCWQGAKEAALQALDYSGEDSDGGAEVPAPDPESPPELDPLEVSQAEPDTSDTEDPDPAQEPDSEAGIDKGLDELLDDPAPEDTPAEDSE